VLQPSYENLGKREVKTPKVYVRDTGLRLDRLLEVHPGKARFPLSKKIEALPLADCLRELA